RCAWTDADLKAMAVLYNTEDHAKKGDFERWVHMVPALKYTHQIDTINADKITFNNKPPREITSNDVMHAYSYGKFTKTGRKYEEWKKYCGFRNSEVPAGFEKWEFEFERAWFYMQAGKLRAARPNDKTIDISQMEVPKCPLDNRKEDPGSGMPPKNEDIPGKEILCQWSK
ncbi:MAG: hypothetical protein L6R42_007747, partial [Xanthoria sp. 1 TBL-2021]